MERYESPRIVELGTVQELTLDTFHKHAGTGDFVVIDGGAPISIPGSSLS
jgi:hypothetical protein